MCAIAGVYAYRARCGPAEPGEIIRMREAMASRGPDGAGWWGSADNRVQLAHRRLAIIDPGPAGSQPMQSADGRFVVSFNGEIYNHGSLRQDLASRGHVFRSRADTEVLLALYAEHGQAGLPLLGGMFAFALFDRQTRHLLLARDPYGIKPLLIADDGGTLRFASQVKALLAGGGVDNAPDPAGIAGFALMGHVPEPFTLHRAIRMLPAGHVLDIGPDAPPRLYRYASIADTIATAGSGASEEAVSCCRAAVRESVARHLVADADVGLFLSAGVDSGALLGTMRDMVGNGPIQAITLGFDDFAGTPADETVMAASVAARYGARHRIVRLNRREVAAALPAVLEAMDQPSIDGVNTWLIARAAREAGLKVALSGTGGDELFGGYSTFQTVPSTLRLAVTPAAVPGLGLGARKLAERLLPGLKASNPKALAVLELGGTWPGAYLLRRGLFMPHELPDLLGPDLAREGLERLAPLGLIGSSLTPAPGSAFRRVAALEAGNYLRNQLLRDADWAGMAHGVEIRMPLVDHALLQRVAPHMDHLARGGGKAVLAGVPQIPLPFEVVARTKTGFSVPVQSWLTGKSNAHNDRISSRLWAREVLDVFLGGALQRRAA